MKSQKITLPKTKEVKRQWLLVDASTAPLGRIATAVANVLRGKHKRDFTPHMDMGDYVVAINADRLKFTGRKLQQKMYYRHSGYLGGLKSTVLKDEMIRRPEMVLKKAVLNMLDDVKFRKKLMSRFKVVKGDKHSFKIDRDLKA